MGFPRFSQGPERGPNKKARHTEALGWLPYAGLGTERALVVLLLAGTGILALVLAVLVLRLVVLALVLVVLILAVLAILRIVGVIVLVVHNFLTSCRFRGSLSGGKFLLLFLVTWIVWQNA